MFAMESAQDQHAHVRLDVIFPNILVLLFLSRAEGSLRHTRLDMNEGKHWKKKLWSEQGRAGSEKLALAAQTSRHRQELLELLDRTFAAGNIRYVLRPLSLCASNSHFGIERIKGVKCNVSKGLHRQPFSVPSTQRTGGRRGIPFLQCPAFQSDLQVINTLVLLYLYENRSG